MLEYDRLSDPPCMHPRNRAISVPNLATTRSNNELPSHVFDKSGVAYEVGRFLGKGGFAKCFLATSDQQEFALKVISKSTIQKPSHATKIKREILTHYSLRHPNIVALYSSFEDAENRYMLLEYCPNRTLADYIESTPGRFINEPNALIFLKQLLKAVNYLHIDCGILHRDIKPGNILLSREFTVKLADFGFCASIKELEQRTEHAVCGTPNYVPYEVIQRMGHSVYSESWAIACTFYCMLYGKPPFHSESLETTYAKIRHCDYIFPSHFPVSMKAQDFVRRILVADRLKRLTVDGMIIHPIFSPISRSFSYGSGLNSATENKQLQLCHSTNRKTTEFSPNPTYIREKNKNVLVDSGLGVEVLQGNVSKFIGQILERYVKCITCVLDSQDKHYLFPLDTELPPSFVIKWVDYTNKFGFGATLKDGTRAILFNDQSTISVSASENRFSYRRRKFDEEALSWPALDQPPTNELAEKMELLRFLRKYMDRELYSFLGQEPTADKREYCQRKSSSGHESGDSTPDVSHIGGCRTSRSHLMPGAHRGRRSVSHTTRRPLTHIVDFRKMSNALLMLMSDGTCQVNFTNTRCKLAFSIATLSDGRRAIRIHFVTADHTVHAFELGSSLDLSWTWPDELSAHLSLMEMFLSPYCQTLNAKHPAFCSTDC
ncbi:protein kinase domain-containing protein [Ditylenchus destructor]|nr:protein kinase domain-containing protein [Ditylenchus destructor]